MHKLFSMVNQKYIYILAINDDNIVPVAENLLEKGRNNRNKEATTNQKL